MFYRNLLEGVGHTPLVRLNRLPQAEGIQADVLAKCEFFNPGGSVKDRIGIHMVEEVERQGRLKPGGTLIEATSGNTGLGLALVAIVKGYKLIITITDKQSPEKVRLLQALGAEVVICPYEVPPDDPRSYYSVANRLNQEIPNSVYLNQYENAMNPQAHYEGTGPELWRDTDGKIDAFVAGMGTGGTLCGTGKFLKEKKASIQVVGVDPVGSILYDAFYKNPLRPHPYKVEGIGEDKVPKTVDFTWVDKVIQVTDQEGVDYTRKLIRQEGILAGWSSGAALCAAIQVAQRLPRGQTVVVLLPDSISRYISRLFNEEWLKQHGFS